MSTGLHKELEIAEIHRPYAFEYANAAARTGASGFVAADVGKFARQTDDNSIWILTATTPTWIQVGGGTNDEDAIHDNVSGEVAAVAEKTAPVALDLLLIEDSAASNAKKKIQIGNLPVIVGDAAELIVEVQKGSPGTINPGQAVYLSGWDGGAALPEVELADASAAATMPAFGIARTTIGQATTGTVVVAGTLEGLDTSAWSVKDALYVSETTGALTNSKPTGTALVQKVAQVLRDNPTLGTIQVFGAGRVNDLPNLPQDDVWLGNSSGVPVATSRSGIDDDAIHDNVSGEISSITEKTSPVSADLLVIEDSAASNQKKKIQIGNLPVVGGVFGDELFYHEDLVYHATNSVTPVTVYNQSTPSLPNGTYFWSINARIGITGSKNYNANFIVYLDDVIVGSSVLTDALIKVHQVVQRQDVLNGVTNFKIEYYVSNDASGANIQYITTSLWRVS